MHYNLARFITASLAAVSSGGIGVRISGGRGGAGYGLVCAAPLDGDIEGLEGGSSPQKFDDNKESSALVLTARQEQHQQRYQHYQNELYSLLSKRVLGPASRRALEVFVVYFVPALVMNQLAILYDDEDWKDITEDEDEDKKKELELEQEGIRGEPGN